tara:strand:+ start:1079 stop:1267 length:189 start_codon:yes stop_codon:yes gene_type:complete
MKYNNITNDMKIILMNEAEQKRLIKYNKEKTNGGLIDYWKALAIIGIATAIVELYIIIELIK